MDLTAACAHCQSLPHVEADTPFGPEVLVYKVGGKLFALTEPEQYPPRMNLKCDPERAVSLRDQHEGITPGYHMNKRHWNTVSLDGTVPSKLVRELIDHSYELVAKSLTAKVRKELGL